MALNSSGPISLAGTTAGQSIELENGGNGTTQISLNDTAVRTLAGVPSGAITMPTNFWGKSNAFTFTATIAANTTNYVITSAATAAGWNGTTALSATITINAGVYVYSTSTGTPAFSTGSGIPSGSTISIVNNGTILGRGGAGGNGGVGGSGFATSGAGGGSGGTGLYVQYATSVTNNNRISGGGGGGGGGGGVYNQQVASYGGGGGGGGIGNGSNGGGGSGNQGNGSAGGSGSLTAAGNGGGGNGSSYFDACTGVFSSAYGGSGGNGGTFGTTGSNGASGSNVGTGASSAGGGGSGGAAGGAVVGNSFITWVATGTRNGSIT